MACRFGGAALAALLLLPLATATSGEGDLTATGTTLFPNGTNATFNPLAFFIANTTQLSATLTTPLLRVWTFERSDIVVQPGIAPAIAFQTPGHKETSFTVHNATVTFQASPGYFGLYSRNGGSFGFQARSDFGATPEGVSVIPAGYPYTTDTPDSPFYSQKITTPHLDLTAAGAAEYAGPGALKPIGPLVRIVAGENTTETQTGVEQANPAEQTTRWQYLEWDNGSLSITTGRPAQMAAPELSSFAADGFLTLTPTAGELDTDHARYVADGTQASIDGRFTGSLVPTSDGSAARLTLAGGVRSSSMRAESVRAPIGPHVTGLNVPWLALAIGGLALAGSAAAVVAARRAVRYAMSRRHGRAPIRQRAAPAPLVVTVTPPAPMIIPQAQRAKLYARRARKLADRGRWELASYFLHRSLRLDPLDPGERLLDHAIALRSAGKLAEALRAFEKAAPILGDGEPEARAARICLMLRDPARAEATILRALDRPGLDAAILSEIATDKVFHPLREKQPVREAIQAAEARLFPDGPGGAI